jgi:hypothetical protein
MTNSISSVSPQRRISGNNMAGSPYSTNQPYSMSSGTAGYKPRQYTHRYSNSGGVLPTPEHTLSVISDEDVARQLMRLGDASNFSTHGRTSTSTLDDTFSGKADAASSSDESDDGSQNGSELPPLPYTMERPNNHVRAYDNAFSSGDEYDDNNDSFKGESDDVVPHHHDEIRVQFGAPKARSSISNKSGKPSKPRSLSTKSKPKTNGASKPPMSPTSLPSQSRKASLNFQHQFGADDEDLSSKPRCQRCRKSKKGCDRQRPCQRCKDAGIGAEGCVSEDEGNGRKGRYGRHMGVSVKTAPATTSMGPPPMHEHHSMPLDAASHFALTASALDKSKKRKR